nr:uncharacterized protein LOC113820155 [Penaeus vannamei]
MLSLPLQTNHASLNTQAGEATSRGDQLQADILARGPREVDITKAFDKVWHDGLKYKITQFQLPPHLTRLLCNFLDDRTANIRVGSCLGPPSTSEVEFHRAASSRQPSTPYTLPPPAPYSY